MNLVVSLAAVFSRPRLWNPDGRVAQWLKGADAISWFQGQATQDLRGISEGESRGWCLCTPTGQLAAFGDAVRWGSDLLLVTPAAALPVLEHRVEWLVISEDVRLEPAEGELMRVLGGRAEGDRVWQRSVGDRWTLGPAASTRGIELLRPVEQHAVRVALGEPEFGVDTSDKTLPPELGPAFESATISYTKGCYTGQEILMRVHSRGHTNQQWVALVGDRPAAPNDPVLDRNGASVGRVTSTARLAEFGEVSLAMVRHAALASPEGLRLGERPVSVWPLPLWSANQGVRA